MDGALSLHPTQFLSSTYALLFYHMSGVAQGMSNVELGLRAFLDDLPGRGVPGGCFPSEKQLHLGNNVQVHINQIPHQPAVGGSAVIYQQFCAGLS